MQAVVGIDVGTSASGYAFAFTATPNDIHDGCLAKNPRYHKAPTLLWNDSTGAFRAFGLRAQDGYAQDEDGDRNESFLFSNFKMALYGATKDPLVVAANDTEHPLLDVMSKTIMHIRDEAVLKLKSTLGQDMALDKIRWVITVPAIWSDFANNFMRRVCLQAGLIESIDSSNLVLAIEPEAAVASCLFSINPVVKLSNGSKFILVDCGGGTVDITAHSISSGGYEDEPGRPLSLIELAAPTGGAWGSGQVEENFLRMLMQPLLGHALYAKFMRSQETKLAILNDFEDKIKKPHSILSTSPKRLNIASLVADVFKGTANYNRIIQSKVISDVVDEELTMKDLVEEFNAKRESRMRVELIQNLYIKIPSLLISSFFDPLVDNITSSIDQIIAKIGPDISTMFLVGGFSESPYLQEKLRNYFGPKDITLKLPPSPGSSVMLGAVRFGLFPKMFSSRISRYTYGVKCTSEFDAFVKAGETVPNGFIVERCYRPAKKNQSVVSIHILISTDPSPDTAEGVPILATLRIRIPSDFKQDRLVRVKMSFGAIEFNAVASIGDIMMESAIDFNQLEAPNSQHFCSSTPTVVHFLVDVSTSMNGTASPGNSRLDDAKTGVRFILQNLLKAERKDMFTVAQFSDSRVDLCQQSKVGSSSNQYIILDDLQIIGGTMLFKSCIEQLDMISLLVAKDSVHYAPKRFLVVFTDGGDTSSTTTFFENLLEKVNTSGGICDSLTGFIIIAVGLESKDLDSLKKLSQSGKLTIIAMEKATDIVAAFSQASDEIEKLRS